MIETPKKQSKSDRTRAAILAAASALFAARGYERTTVRDIAAQAGIDPAMVIRYFGSKDELFARASVFDLRLPDFASVPRSELGTAIVRHFIGMWEGEGAGTGLTVLLRSAASNPYAAAKLREVFAAQVLPALARVGSPAEAAERGGLVSSQLLGLALCRYVLKLPPVVAMPPERIVSEIGRTIQRYVDSAP